MLGQLRDHVGMLDKSAIPARSTLPVRPLAVQLNLEGLLPVGHSLPGILVLNLELYGKSDNNIKDVDVGRIQVMGRDPREQLEMFRQIAVPPLAEYLPLVRGRG